MRLSFAGRPGLVVLIALSLLSVIPSAEAKEGFYLGGGYAQQSLSGGLNGKKAFVSPDDTVAILAGKPDSGTGLALNLGFGFSPQVSFDFLYGSSSHTAKHDLVDFSSSMTLATTLLSVRLQVPIQENLEFVGRAGLATTTATFSKYGIEGTNLSSGGSATGTGEAKFSGSGFGFGAGIEYFVDKVSVSANYTLMNISFDEAEGGGVSGTLENSLSSTINQVTFLVVYYFQ